MNSNPNLYAILAANFPADRSSCAIEANAADGRAQYYSWADIDAATAQLANLLGSLGLPPAARVAAFTNKSVEALLLCLATLRAGQVYLPLNTACQPRELANFLENASPSVLVCAPAAFSWLSKQAFAAGVGHVFTLGVAQQGSLLERAARHPAKFGTVQAKAADLAAILYTVGTAGLSKNAMLSHGNLSLNDLTLNGVWARLSGDVLLHALPGVSSRVQDDSGVA